MEQGEYLGATWYKYRNDAERAADGFNENVITEINDDPFGDGYFLCMWKAK